MIESGRGSQREQRRGRGEMAALRVGVPHIYKNILGFSKKQEKRIWTVSNLILMALSCHVLHLDWCWYQLFPACTGDNPDFFLLVSFVSTTAIYSLNVCEFTVHALRNVRNVPYVGSSSTNICLYMMYRDMVSLLCVMYRIQQCKVPYTLFTFFIFLF